MQKPSSSSLKNVEWSLVIQRAGATWVDIWVGNLRASFNAQLHLEVHLIAADQSVVQIKTDVWHAPFRDLEHGQYQLIHFDNLLAQTSYTVEVHLKAAANETSEIIGAGAFTTLPKKLPKLGAKPFTIAFGSCFSNHDDKGQLSSAYQALCEKGAPEQQPDITFLMGDQVYLDNGFSALVPFKFFIRKRIANVYAKNWQAFSSVFAHGATWMLPDDHEYWNDYPFNELPILALQALKIKSVRDTWVAAADDAVTNIQSAKMFETIEIGKDLSICLVNTRSKRTAQYFLPPQEFQQLINWAENLSAPGVLVLPQNLLDKAHDIEKNLLSYPQQYSELLQALCQSGKDVVVLSGDVHFGRIGRTELGDSGAQLIELVASPLANLSGLFDGIATAQASDSPHTFPPLDKPIAGIPSKNIKYPEKVGGIKGRAFTQHPKDRTQEHFMTVGFSKLSSGEIQIQVQAWLVRQQDSLTGLPKAGFSEPWKALLRV